MERGALGSLDYQMTFPTQQAAAAGAGQGGGPINPQGYLQAPPKDPLAVREKLTSDYYNNYNLLQNVVKDALAQGLNPFEPDYSQEGGGLAFQTFQRAQAGLMYAANALGNEFEAEKQTRPYELSGQARMVPGAQREGLYYSDPNNFMSTKLPQGVEETNQRLAQTTQTPQDQNRANQLLQLEVQKIDQQVQQGIISPQEGEYYKSQLVPNVYKTPVFAPRDDGSGKKREFYQKRSELIKQVKAGILTKDPSPLNLLRRAPGVESVRYVNTGDRVGIELDVKGQEPTFIDLTKGGQAEINAILNRIEGQMNVPNEELFNFDTNVDIPESDASPLIERAKSSVLAGDLDDTLKSIQSLARQGRLITPDNEVIASIEPYTNWLGTKKYTIKYYKPDKNGQPSNKILEKTIDVEDDQEYLSSLVDVNSNDVADILGAGFAKRQEATASQLTARQQAALTAFEKQLGRKPTPTEEQGILTKYK